MHDERYASLQARLSRLETELAALRSELRQSAPSRLDDALAQPPPVQPPPVQPAQFAPQPPPYVPQPPPFLPTPSWTFAPGAAPRVTAAGVRAAGASTEAFFAGRGLQIAGLVLVLIGVAFFINLAFAHGWIGPAQRIVLGLVTGIALLAEGARRRRPVDVAIAESATALGAGILYLSLWGAAVVFPELHVSHGVAFAGMTVVTAVLGALAYARSAQRIALLGILGGFLTPLLLDDGTPHFEALALYLAVLTGAFGLLGAWTRFTQVTVASFAGCAMYLPAFAFAPPAWDVPHVNAVLAGLSLEMAAIVALAAVNDARRTATAITLTAVDALVYALMVTIAFRDDRHALGIALLLLAAVSFAVTRVVVLPGMLRVAYAYIGIAAATLAMPAFIAGTEIVDVFAVEGALLVALGAARNDRRLACFGSIVAGYAALAVFGDSFSEAPQFTAISPIALALAVTVAALAVVRHVAARWTQAAPVNAIWARAAGIATTVLAVAAIRRVALDALAGPWTTAGVPSHAQVAISLGWTAYAAGAFAAGMRRGSMSLRRQGLAVFALTILKVFVIDLSGVDVAWRVASFIGLGLVCLALSAWYMRANAQPAGGA